MKKKSLLHRTGALPAQRHSRRVQLDVESLAVERLIDLHCSRCAPGYVPVQPDKKRMIAHLHREGDVILADAAHGNLSSL